MEDVTRNTKYSHFTFCKLGAKIGRGSRFCEIRG